MTYKSSNDQRNAVDLIVQARDARNAALMRVIRHIFRTPEAVVAKCHLEPQVEPISNSAKPSNRRAVNPLTLRGLHIS
ncbi:MAG: hypothetical protein AAF530_02205 [Pseudomonadota bacterium]